MLNRAVQQTCDIVVEDVNNNIAGGDKLLAAADAYKAEIGKLLDKMGLEYNLEENADGDAAPDGSRGDKEEVTILDDDDIEEMMINGDVE